MAKQAYSKWVEGTEFHWVASDQSEWKIVGEFVKAAPSIAKKGSIWLDVTTEQVFYVDQNRDVRKLQKAGTPAGPHLDAAAIQGSSWPEVDDFRFISTTGGQEEVVHDDTIHDNHDDHNDEEHENHNDHDNEAHGDEAHENQAYVDHLDHLDHDDVALHQDNEVHGDIEHENHTDQSAHDDHQDHDDEEHVNFQDHFDEEHSDQPVEVGP